MKKVVSIYLTDRSTNIVEKYKLPVYILDMQYGERIDLFYIRL